MGLLNHMVVLFLHFRRISIAFSLVSASLSLYRKAFNLLSKTWQCLLLAEPKRKIAYFQGYILFTLQREIVPALFRLVKGSQGIEHDMNGEWNMFLPQVGAERRKHKEGSSSERQWIVLTNHYNLITIFHLQEDREYGHSTKDQYLLKYGHLEHLLFCFQPFLLIFSNFPTNTRSYMIFGDVRCQLNWITWCSTRIMKVQSMGIEQSTCALVDSILHLCFPNQ